MINLTIIVILILGAYLQLSYANTMISGKLNSFDSVKIAGEWIKENSEPGDIVISSSLPQMTYYSERETYPFQRSTPVSDDPVVRTTEEEFDKFIKEKRPRYITDSLWENVPQWVHQYPQKHNDTLIPVQGYFMGADKSQLSLVIYEVQYN